VNLRVCLHPPTTHFSGAGKKQTGAKRVREPDSSQDALADKKECNMKKRILLAGALIAAAATPAMANTDGESINVNGRVPAMCRITANDHNIALGSVIDSDGFLDADLQSRILTQLNSVDVFAWCNGSNNVVNAFREALLLDGSDGTTQPGGFATAVGFDVGIQIGDTEPNGINDGYTYDEGTSDGEGSGPGGAAPFGATGLGAPITFVSDNWGGPAFLTPVAVDVPSAGFTGPTTGFTTLGAVRPAAGRYRGRVTIRLTSGL
jgi:hypothetical protein